jgi:hypothetical protein
MKKNIYTTCKVLCLLNLLGSLQIYSADINSSDDEIDLLENQTLIAKFILELPDCSIEESKFNPNECSMAKVTFDSVPKVKNVNPVIGIGASYPHGAIVQVGFTMGHTYKLKFSAAYSNNFNKTNQLQTYGFQLDAFFKGFHTGFFYKKLNVDSNLIAGPGVSFPLVGPSIGYQIKNCFKIGPKKISCDFEFDANFILFPTEYDRFSVNWYQSINIKFSL